MSLNKNSKIFIAGHNGMVGSAAHKKLIENGYNNILIKDKKNLNLLNQKSVNDFFNKEKPEYVLLAAAKVGGIKSNNIYRADFIYQNSQIQNNIIHQSYLHNVKKLIFLGSSCIYPKNSKQPIKENYLLNSELEYTNEPYAIAKILGLKMCEAYNIQHLTNFISLMPTNLYGNNDNYDLDNSHVLPALIRKIHLAKCIEEKNIKDLRKDFEKNPITGLEPNFSFDECLSILSNYGIIYQNNSVTVKLWGTGKPRREFLHADDLADAIIYILENINFNDLHEKNQIINSHINIGTGKDISINELSILIKEIVQFKGNIIFDQNQNDGTFQKLLDISKITKLGWRHQIKFKEGVKSIYNSYIS